MAVIPQVALDLLLRKFGADQAQLDLEENRARSQYATAQGDLARQQARQRERLDVQMADQGLAHSGIAAAQNLRRQEAANQQNQRAAQTINDTLANIARRRLEAQFAYDTARLGVEQ